MSNVKYVLTKVGAAVNVLLKLLLVIIMAFPFLWMISTAFKTFAETQIFPPTMLPQSPTIDNFIHVFKSMPILTYALNSTIVSVSILILQYVVIVPAAYGFARYNFKGKNIMFAVVLLGLMLPQQITFVPVYMMFTKMGLMKSLIPQILPFISNSFGIFMLRQYFMQLPQEIIEAAKLDDCSEFTIMRKIMMPMASNALVTIGLVSFINSWNNYFWPLIMTNSDSLRTLPIGIATLKNQELAQMWNYIMAGNVILVLPILIVYIFANKRIQKAFVYSGIK